MIQKGPQFKSVSQISQFVATLSNSFIKFAENTFAGCTTPEIDHFFESNKAYFENSMIIDGILACIIEQRASTYGITFTSYAKAHEVLKKVMSNINIKWLCLQKLMKPFNVFSTIHLKIFIDLYFELKYAIKIYCDLLISRHIKDYFSGHYQKITSLHTLLEEINPRYELYSLFILNHPSLYPEGFVQSLRLQSNNFEWVYFQLEACLAKINHLNKEQDPAAKIMSELADNALLRKYEIANIQKCFMQRNPESGSFDLAVFLAELSQEKAKNPDASLDLFSQKCANFQASLVSKCATVFYSHQRNTTGKTIVLSRLSEKEELLKKVIADTLDEEAKKQLIEDCFGIVDILQQVDELKDKEMLISFLDLARRLCLRAQIILQKFSNTSPNAAVLILYFKRLNLQLLETRNFYKEAEMHADSELEEIIDTLSASRDEARELFVKCFIEEFINFTKYIDAGTKQKDILEFIAPYAHLFEKKTLGQLLDELTRKLTEQISQVIAKPSCDDAEKIYKGFESVNSLYAVLNILIPKSRPIDGQSQKMHFDMLFDLTYSLLPYCQGVYKISNSEREVILPLYERIMRYLRILQEGIFQMKIVYSFLGDSSKTGVKFAQAIASLEVSLERIHVYSLLLYNNIFGRMSVENNSVERLNNSLTLQGIRIKLQEDFVAKEYNDSSSYLSDLKKEYQKIDENWSVFLVSKKLSQVRSERELFERSLLSAFSRCVNNSDHQGSQEKQSYVSYLTHCINHDLKILSEKDLNNGQCIFAAMKKIFFLFTEVEKIQDLSTLLAFSSLSEILCENWTVYLNKTTNAEIKTLALELSYCQRLLSILKETIPRYHAASSFFVGQEFYEKASAKLLNKRIFTAISNNTEEENRFLTEYMPYLKNKKRIQELLELIQKTFDIEKPPAVEQESQALFQLAFLSGRVNLMYFVLYQLVPFNASNDHCQKLFFQFINELPYLISRSYDLYMKGSFLENNKEKHFALLHRHESFLQRALRDFYHFLFYAANHPSIENETVNILDPGRNHYQYRLIDAQIALSKIAEQPQDRNSANEAGVGTLFRALKAYEAFTALSTPGLKEVAIALEGESSFNRKVAELISNKNLIIMKENMPLVRVHFMIVDLRHKINQVSARLCYLACQSPIQHPKPNIINALKHYEDKAIEYDFVPNAVLELNTIYSDINQLFKAFLSVDEISDRNGLILFYTQAVSVCDKWINLARKMKRPEAKVLAIELYLCELDFRTALSFVRNEQHYDEIKQEMLVMIPKVIPDYPEVLKALDAHLAEASTIKMKEKKKEEEKKKEKEKEKERKREEKNVVEQSIIQAKIKNGEVKPLIRSSSLTAKQVVKAESQQQKSPIVVTTSTIVKKRYKPKSKPKAKTKMNFSVPTSKEGTETILPNPPVKLESAVQVKQKSENEWKEGSSFVEKFYAKHSKGKPLPLQVETIEPALNTSIKPWGELQTDEIKQSDMETTNLDEIELLATSMLQIQLKESQVDMRSVLPEEDIVQGFMIVLPENVRHILIALESKGYWAFVVGGYLRDMRLNIARPHDVDIITNCPPTLLAKYFPDFIQNSFNPNLCFRKGILSIDICYTTSPIKNGLASRDITINTLLCDNKGNVYDVLKIIHDFDSPCLNLMGHLEERLQADPSLILRLIRLSKVTGKTLPYHYVPAMQRYAPAIVKLPFGIYASNLEAMFLRGHGSYNLYYLDKLGLFPYLLPFKWEIIAIDVYHQILHFTMIQMLKIDQLSVESEIKDRRSLLFALFLLGECLQREHLTKADPKDIMDKVVNDFYDYFKVNNFEKRTKTLSYLHLYYQQYREIVDNNSEITINLQISQQRAAQAARGELFIPDLIQAKPAYLPSYYKEASVDSAIKEMVEQKPSYHYAP